MISADCLMLAEAVLTACRERGLTVATAESCTGGLVAAALTAVPGSSDVFEHGFIVYSNRAKSEMLGVPERTIASHGAVSAQVAAAMARCALERSGASLAVAVTGIAGPGGGTPGKPVGLVYLACAQAQRETSVERRLFAGDRAGIREASVRDALEMLQHAAAAA
jgi:nicotinamide-nucleotide amidase